MYNVVFHSETFEDEASVRAKYSTAESLSKRSETAGAADEDRLIFYFIYAALQDKPGYKTLS
jgi:hypothetical protein